MARRRGTPRIITPRLASRATPPSRLARRPRDAPHAPRPFASFRVRSERVQTRSQGVERRGRDRRIHARPRRARRRHRAPRVVRPARRERERASVRRVAPGSLARRGGAREGETLSQIRVRARGRDVVVPRGVRVSRRDGASGVVFE